MYIRKFRVVLVVMILSSILGVGSVIAQLVFSVRIPSSGSIGPLPPVTPVLGASYNSELRAVFLHFTSLSLGNDWNLIAQTLDNYSIPLIVVDAMTPRYATYPSNVIPSWAEAIRINEVLDILHPLGIELYVNMDVQYKVPFIRNTGTPDPQYMCKLADGSQYDWLCATKEVSRNYLKAVVEELVTNYPNIDGFMFDYTRWDLRLDMCYCDECKAGLENWLGETITNFPGDFAPDMPRHKEFLEWRIQPITQLVIDMSGWMKAIKPDLKIAAAPWSIIATEGPAHAVKWLGQDWVDWVVKGYLDWVAPMVYTYPAELESVFRPFVKANIEDGVGGPEGKIPLVILIANQFPVVKTPTELKAEVDVLREEGADGWIIWRYSGPGVPTGEDIVPYLDTIDLHDVFSLRDISTSPSESSCTITWTTDLPATSKVEYSTSPLFNASRKYDQVQDFDYWDIDRVEGTVVEDATLVTSHSITLTSLQEGMLYYYRVQSGGQSGMATSRVYEFKTGV